MLCAQSVKVNALLGTHAILSIGFPLPPSKTWDDIFENGYCWLLPPLKNSMKYIWLDVDPVSDLVLIHC